MPSKLVPQDLSITSTWTVSNIFHLYLQYLHHTACSEKAPDPVGTATSDSTKQVHVEGEIVTYSCPAGYKTKEDETVVAIKCDDSRNWISERYDESVEDLVQKFICDTLGK